MVLIIFQDFRALLVYFKNTTARMRPFRQNHLALLSLVVQQWYGIPSNAFC